MIGLIALDIWLVPATIIILSIYIIAAYARWSFFPFDEWEDVAALVLGSLIWPILVGMGISEYRQQRKTRLTEISQAIEMHYKDKWYE